MKLRKYISDEIVESDDFCGMSISAQALYFHLIMNTDNRGYINRAKKIISAVDGFSMDDLNELVNNKFILKRANNLYLVKGWYIHNDIPTYVSEETNYLEDLLTLYLDEKNYSYTEKETNLKVADIIYRKKPLKENKKEKENKNENINEKIIIDDNNKKVDTDLLNAIDELEKMKE